MATNSMEMSPVGGGSVITSPADAGDAWSSDDARTASATHPAVNNLFTSFPFGSEAGQDKLLIYFNVSQQQPNKSPEFLMPIEKEADRALTYRKAPKGLRYGGVDTV
ncbi:hypothetical protein [Actinoplanes siamensis]|nr:hypothetical protein [Actinoplanes siamensis]